MLGLLLAWQVWPVSWHDTDPSDLRLEHQIDYVIMTADSLAVTGNADVAARRLLELADDDVTIEEIAALVEQVAAEHEVTGDEASALRIRRLAQVTNLPEPADSYRPPRRRAVFAPGSWAMIVLLALFATLGALAWLMMRLRSTLPVGIEPDTGGHPNSARPEAIRPAPAGAGDWVERMRSRIESRRQSPAESEPYRPPSPPEPEPVISIRPADDETSRLWDEPDEPDAEDDWEYAEDEVFDEADESAFIGDDLAPGSAEDGIAPIQAREPEDQIESLEDEQAILDIVSRTLAARQAATEERPAPPPRQEADAEVLGAFEAEYHFGDDDFDCAFTIETPDGEFLGECGIGISDILAADDAQRVTAFEVWLFDKSDVRTETRVLASEFAFNDEDTNARLSAKGDLVPAETGAVILLETLSLQLTATIRRVEYLSDGQTPNGVFSFLNIDLVVERPDAIT